MLCCCQDDSPPRDVGLLLTWHLRFLPNQRTNRNSTIQFQAQQRRTKRNAPASQHQRKKKSQREIQVKTRLTQTKDQKRRARTDPLSTQPTPRCPSSPPPGRTPLSLIPYQNPRASVRARKSPQGIPGGRVPPWQRSSASAGGRAEPPLFLLPAPFPQQPTQRPCHQWWVSQQGLVMVDG